jgi:hypothetical protein
MINEFSKQQNRPENLNNAVCSRCFQKWLFTTKSVSIPELWTAKIITNVKGKTSGNDFFSEKGDETGGLIFDGDTSKGQGGSLTFDKFRGFFNENNLPNKKAKIICSLVN